MLSPLAIAAVAALGSQLFGTAEALGVNCLASSLVCPVLSLANNLAGTGSAVFGQGGLTCNFGSGVSLIQCNYDANGALVTNALTSNTLLCAANIKTCTSCPAGNALLNGDCTACPAGTYSLLGNVLTACTACPTGFTSAAGSGTCTPVAAAPATGCLTTSLSCPTANLLNVAVGTIGINAGITTCAYGASTCTYDANGLLTTTNGFLLGCAANLISSCLTCPAGTGLLNGACNNCAANTYGIAGNAVACLTCPVGFAVNALQSGCNPVPVTTPTGCATVQSTCPTQSILGLTLLNQVTVNANIQCTFGPVGSTLVCLYDAVTGLLTSGSSFTACAASIAQSCATCPLATGLVNGACQNCPAGQFAVAGGILPCQTCPTGYVPTADKSSCTFIAPTTCATSTSACPAVDAAGNAYNAAASSIFVAGNQLSCVYGAAAVDVCIYGLNNGLLTGTSLGNNLCLSTAVTVCSSCPAGFGLENLVCVPCISGSVAGVGVNVCTACGPTQIPNADNSACILRPSGVITRQRRQRRVGGH